MAIEIETVQTVAVETAFLEIGEGQEVGLKLRDSDGKTIYDYLGQTPQFLDGRELVIDLATGQILNWEAPTGAEIQKVIEDKL